LLYTDGGWGRADAENLCASLLASPEELRNQPPLIVKTGQLPFVNANQEYCEKLSKARNKVEWIEFPNSWHGFSAWMLDEWEGALQAIADAIRACPPVGRLSILNKG